MSESDRDAAFDAWNDTTDRCVWEPDEEAAFAAGWDASRAALDDRDAAFDVWWEAHVDDGGSDFGFAREAHAAGWQAALETREATQEPQVTREEVALPVEILNLARDLDGWLEDWYAQSAPRTPDTRGKHLARALLAKYTMIAKGDGA